MSNRNNIFNAKQIFIVKIIIKISCVNFNGLSIYFSSKRRCSDANVLKIKATLCVNIKNRRDVYNKET